MAMTVVDSAFGSEAHVHLVSLSTCIRWHARGEPWRLISIDTTHFRDSQTVTVTYELLLDHIRVTDWATMRSADKCNL